MKLSNLGAKRLSLFFKNVLSNEAIQRFSMVLEDNITIQDIELAEQEYTPKTSTEDFIWNTVYTNDIAKVCLELAFFYDECIYANDLFRLLEVNQTDGVTLYMATVVLGYDTISNSSDILEAYNIVNKILSIKEYNYSIDRVVFYADFSLLHLIGSEHYIPSTDLKNYVEFSYKPNNDYIPFWDTATDNIFKNIFKGSSSIGIIYGDDFSGRKTIVKNTVCNNGYNLLLVDYKYFISTESLVLSILKIVRECYLLHSVLCICNVHYINDNITEQYNLINIINSIMIEYLCLDLPLFITAKPNVSIVSCLDYPCYSFHIPKLSSSQSELAWKYYTNRYSFYEESCFDEISKRIILPIGKIQNVIYTSIVQNTYNDKRTIIKMCYNILDDKSFKGVSKIYPEYTWEDLKLPPHEKDTLKQICAYVKYKNTIMEDFGMAKSYQYGSCASALFTGPPGTGKTMSAHVIANALNLALYKVDLSQIMDKYIGETEKHLNNIFEYAENSNAVLFFDEADALIGKRSDISDAKDKYANTQVSYILQRIEDFNGVVLMATNFSNNIDPAIMRRIRYVINFKLPNSEIREEIWKSMFNDKIPHENLDFKLLSSDDFEFTGAMIKNIVLSSITLAISEGSPITMKHISNSIRMEYLKSNRTILPPSIQQYL